MTQKSRSKWYAAVTANLAIIVDSWPKAQALTSGMARGKVKGAKTYEEAEKLLKELIAERDRAVNFKRHW